MNRLGWRVLVFEGRPPTGTQRRVLECLAEGMTTSETADYMRCSYFTVQEHIRRILIKLQARNRTNAVAIALREGIIE